MPREGHLWGEGTNGNGQRGRGRSGRGGRGGHGEETGNSSESSGGREDWPSTGGVNGRSSIRRRGRGSRRRNESSDSKAPRGPHVPRPAAKDHLTHPPDSADTPIPEPLPAIKKILQKNRQVYHPAERFRDSDATYTVMCERFLIDVDYEKLDSGEGQEVDFKVISYLDRALVTVKQDKLETASQFILKNFNACTIYAVATELEIADVITLLNNGAVKVFVTFDQFKEIVSKKLLEDLSRLVVSLDHSICTKSTPFDFINSMRDEMRNLDREVNLQDVGVHIHDVHDCEVIQKLASNKKKHESQSFTKVYASLSHATQDLYVRVTKMEAIPIVPATSVSYSMTKHPWKLPAASLLCSSLESDRPDGLYPTVVANEQGVCLGMVYSSCESVDAALSEGRGVYKSRRREGLWHKGETSGDIQELVRIGIDCDGDALLFTVKQKGYGFCHLKTETCFGPYTGLSRLEKTLQTRARYAPEDSYTARLFKDPKLLKSKILEEADELVNAETKEDIASEAADLLYFALTKCIAAGVGLSDVERSLDLKSLKVTRRKGDAKAEFANKVGLTGRNSIVQMSSGEESAGSHHTVKQAMSVQKSEMDEPGLEDGEIKMRRYKTSETSAAEIKEHLQRPSQRSTDSIVNIVRPIIDEVRKGGDAAVLQYTHKFEKATSLKTPVLRAPFPKELMELPQETIDAMDTSFDNIKTFHAAQKESGPLQVETMPGVVCSRFVRPIERVGLYVPGGTAVLPSSALMLGIPAMVAGCKTIVLASPPRSDGKLTPEVVYAAHKVGAECIVLAGGAQAVAAMAYGTESIPKVDKILGPGNQFVTTAKMLVSNDTTAGVAIDMPAGPSEVLVIADRTANPAFVASDLLSQAEHGVDSQVVLIAVALNRIELKAIETELHNQANALPRVDIVRGAINHSVTLVVDDVEEAMRLSNQYAPEHLILQLENAEEVVSKVENAGSVFVGMWTPESVGDYSAGVNHSLPTYGYAKQYSGVNLSSFTKHITSANLTKQGLKNVGGAVMQMAKVEELEAHRRAVSIRLDHMDGKSMVMR